MYTLNIVLSPFTSYLEPSCPLAVGTLAQCALTCAKSEELPSESRDTGARK